MLLGSSDSSQLEEEDEEEEVGETKAESKVHEQEDKKEEDDEDNEEERATVNVMKPLPEVEDEAAEPEPGGPNQRKRVFVLSGLVCNLNLFVSDFRVSLFALRKEQRTS